MHKWQGWDSNPGNLVPIYICIYIYIPAFNHYSISPARGTISCSFIQLCVPCDPASVSLSVAAMDSLW